MTDAVRIDLKTAKSGPWRLILLAGVCAIGLAAYSVWRRPWPVSLLGSDHASAARQLGLESPYTNARPGVRYVGDQACARCHADVARAYRGHPMGNSLRPIGEVTIPETRPARFEARGLEYSVEGEGGRVVHKETKRGPDGRIVSQNEAEVRYVIGSGEQARAFLLERGDGYLFESPITWYSRKQKWDLSPGYEKDNLHFERFVKPACLFCHSNRFDHVDGTENRYRQPIFLGHSIGCERCHGPGELHLKKPERRGDEPPNIVNPAELSPALREAVCQQCHLQGDIRIVRAGRSLIDYRPGLPLSSIESVFVKADHVGKSRFFGQVEQMSASRCFQASSGKMGCISCHDPHQLPDPEKKGAYYRDRCLSCHAERGCGLPRPERLSRGREDACIDCHMPRSPNEQVPHTATTLHLISRFGDRADPIAEARQRPNGQEAPLVHFHHDQLDAGDRSLVARDLGIALATGNRAYVGWSAKAVNRLALPMLENSLALNAADGAAWQAKGTALWLLGRREDSLSAFQTALAIAPNHEETLIATGTRSAQAGRHDDAFRLFKRAIAINPFRADYHQVVALAHARRQEWNEAIAASRASLRLNPFNHEARMLLIQCLLKSQRPGDAQREFQVLLDNDPPGRDAIQAWFEKNRAQ